jgi:hypothetical protein
MGYLGSGEGRVSDFRGFVGDGFVDSIRSWIWNWQSRQKQADRMLRNFVKMFPPPAPLPKFELRFIDGALWVSNANFTRMEPAK